MTAAAVTAPPATPAMGDEGAYTKDEPHAPKGWDTAPMTDASGKLFSDIAVYDFDKNGFGTVYDDDWTNYTAAMDYGTFKDSSNTLFRMTTAGGGLDTHVQGYTASGADLSGASWVRFYIDTRAIRCSGDVGIGINLYLAKSAKVSSTSASSVLPMFLTDGKNAYSRSSEQSSWTKASVKDGFVFVEEDFCGWVLFPLTSFTHGSEKNKKSENSVSTFSTAISAGYKYLGRTTVSVRTANPCESGTDVFFDSITFSKTGALHTHSYTQKDSFPASCSYPGGNVMSCTCSDSYISYTADAHGHSYSSPKAASDGTVYSICTVCGHVKDEPYSAGLPAGNDDLVTVTYNYGAAGGSVKVRMLRGSVITASDIPIKTSYRDKYTYQFNCWTSDINGITPSNPEGAVAVSDMTFYARYIIADYADKYIGALSVLAASGGAYGQQTGRVVVMGNSNMALYHGMESAFAAAGMQIYNNSIAGSTSYDMKEYFVSCVLSAKPQIIIINVTTNDMAYYGMSEREIICNMKALWEMTKEHLPDTRMFIVSGNPLPGRTEFAETILRTNSHMKKYCESEDGLWYIDSYQKIQNYALQYPTNWDTWTHMNQNALSDVFSDVIRTVKPYYDASKLAQ